MTTILVVRRGGLGDTLLMLPVVHALRAAAPGALLHFAGVREFADVLQRHGAVDRALSSEDLQLWALRGGSGAGAARARLAGYARIVGDDPALAALAPGGARVDVFDPRPQRDDLPLGEQLLARLGLPGPARHALRARRAPPDGTGIVLAPGSGSPRKCWPRERWLELAHGLGAAGRRITVLIGPAERERDDPARWAWPEGAAFLAGLPAAEVGARLARAVLLVGNDSGTTHLAAALCVPTVAIFGPSEPRVWAPVGAHVRVVGGRTEGPPGAPADAVLAAVAALGG